MPEATARQTPPSSASGQYVFAEFRLDLLSRQLYRSDVHVPITTKAFETLLALVRREGQIVTKDELISEVWPDTFVSEDSLTQNISTLRRILEDDAAQPRFIATVARRGYRFVAPVTAELPAAAVTPRLARQPSGVEHDSPAAPSRTDAQVRPSLRPAARWVALATLIAFAAGIAIARRFAPTSQYALAPQLRFTLDVPPDSTLASGGTVSPDGRSIAFIARDDKTGDTKLWIRMLSTGAARSIAGTEGALRPFWSPDAQSIAFFGRSHLRRVSIAGGAPSTICDTVQPRPGGGSWNERDEILFSDFDGLYLVDARGGTATRVLTPARDRKEISVSSPRFLPDGRHFLYEVKRADAGSAGIFARTLEGGPSIQLVDAAAEQVAYGAGSLVYVRDHQLIARPFNASTLTFQGDPAVVVDDVPQDAPISASADGVIAYGGVTVEQLAWFDRAGQLLGTINFPPPAINLALSPDQQTLLGESMGPRSRGLWLLDLTRDVPMRFAAGTYPMWSPDGKSVVFSDRSGSDGTIGLYSKSIDGASDELLMTSPTAPIVNDFTRDGQYIVYVINAGLATKEDIWLLPRHGPAKPAPLLASPAKELHAQVSPDGHWIAYASDEEGGTFQVYIQAFPQLGSKRRVSPNGGSQPQWRGDGHELFYLAADRTLMSVWVTPDSPLRLGPPRPLFRTQPLLGLMTDFRDQYTASADGKRFLVARAAPSSSRELITVLVNWQATRHQIPRT